MGEHTNLPWVIPAGEQNGFIICSGDDPSKPGDILMVVRAPAGRRTVATDQQVNANVALMVKAVNSHEALVKALHDIIAANNEFRKGMPDGWEGDPLQDACHEAAKLLLALK